MDRDKELLAQTEKILKEDVAPNAEQIDLHPEALREVLHTFCEAELMAMRRPAKYGGPEMSEPDFRDFQESIARYSGSFAFLQTQHQSAVSMIARSENEDLKSDYLPKMGNGERLVGIGFSQLRRPGPPLMTAQATDEGYVLNGHVPWITGWSFYHEFLIGATLPDGQAVFGVIPFVHSEKEGGKITISEPMRLAAMESAMTVTADISNWHMPAHKVAFIRPAGWIQNNDLINITLQGHFALGCARAGLDILKRVSDKKNLPFLHEAHKALHEELENCRVATTTAQASPSEESTQERLNIRAWAIDLAVRCAHAAVTASSGAANSIQNPAQRVYREALVYTVSAQTTQIMEATLKRIVLRGES
ncbi:MAG TPA: acyl-CoA dehydrogenase family protein [Fimbriimonadaceae bacterium]|jgi:alkylation response protein AidB-like acyl-CoA dehydrogenase